VDPAVVQEKLKFLRDRKLILSFDRVAAAEASALSSSR